MVSRGRRSITETEKGMVMKTAGRCHEIVDQMLGLSANSLWAHQTSHQNCIFHHVRNICCHYLCISAAQHGGHIATGYHR